MRLSEGIRKVGFRKWYERELIAGHAHLVLLLCCAVGLLATFEVFSRAAPLSEKVFDFGAIVLFTAVGAWSLRRYLFLLMRAEATATQAVCPACKTYARFGLAQGEAPAGEVRVRCRKCEHEWGIAE